MERPEKYISILGVAVATVAATLIVKKAITKRNGFSEGTEIPSPKGDYFYLGHLPLLGKRPGKTITKWHKELGPIFKIKVGVQNWVFVGDPEAAHELLVTKGISTSGRPFMTFLSKINSPGERGVIFVDYSKKWKEARNAILHILSPKSVESLSHVLERESQQVVDLMRKQARENPEIDPGLFARLAGINLMLAIAYGVPGAKNVEEPTFKKIEYFATMAMVFSSPSEDYSVILPSLKFLDFIFRKEKKMTDFRDKEFHPFVREIMKLARESKEDSLVKKMDEIKEEYQLDEMSVLCLLSETLTAGTDTTAVSTAWAIAVLCHHPNVQKKICDELDVFIKKHGQRVPQIPSTNGHWSPP
ncbi:hypothetical protein G6F56_010167 [Rhizopus delemar]|nr:hypothetical protein G6F56_010167 [Rhizopus delemar]